MLNEALPPFPTTMDFHNHCWNEDGTCYGAYGDGPDGKCTLINEGIQKLGRKKYYETK